MNSTRPLLRPLALALFSAVVAYAPLAQSQTTATTDPVGFFTLTALGASDSVLSIPLQQMPVFGGFVQTPGASTLTIAAGTSGGQPVSPAWTANQFAYNASSQRQTFFVEFASGALQGSIYKIVSNTANTLTLDTEGDDLTNRPPLGAVAANDSIKIRPYWRIKDVFEVNGQPVIEARTLSAVAKDHIAIPEYGTVGVNKTPTLIIYYYQGWKAVGRNGDYADQILRPNEALILRRRNPLNLNFVTLGQVEVDKSVAFIPGGDGVSANDTYFSISHAAPVKLDDSGLWNSDPAKSVIKTSTSDSIRQDEVFAFNTDKTGYNNAPPKIYYYKQAEGWKMVGGTGVVGQTEFLQPGRAYIVRKKKANAGVDWIKQANY